MHPWSSTPLKRLKTTALCCNRLCCLLLSLIVHFYAAFPFKHIKSQNELIISQINSHFLFLMQEKANI